MHIQIIAESMMGRKIKGSVGLFPTMSWKELSLLQEESLAWLQRGGKGEKT